MSKDKFNKGNNRNNDKKVSTEDIVRNINKLKKQSIFDYKSKYEEKIEKDSEVQKCIKEMQEMEEKNDKKNSLIMILAIGAVCVVVLCIVVKMISTPSGNLLGKKIPQDNKTEDNGKTKTPSEAISDVKKEETLEDKIGVTNNKIYTFALGEESRKKAFNTSIKINDNNPSGITAIYIAEILRNAEVPVSKEALNTKNLVDSLKNLGWKTYTNPKELRKGDVCFTTEMSSMPGHPSHVYIFMGWVKEGNTDMAFICDSLVKDNNNEWIHKRNIDFETEDKQKMAFFMRAE